MKRSAPPSRRGQRRSCSTARTIQPARYIRKPPLRPSAARSGTGPIFILCDDVYRGLCTRPCPDPAALPGLRERLLIAQSFSKPWAMTGWRIGYLMSSAPVIRKLTALHGHILTCVPSMLQAACETALETDTAPMRETYAKRRALVLRRLHAMGLCCPVPEGAFYAFPDIRAFGLCSEAFCLRLIAEGRDRSSTRKLLRNRGAYPHILLLRRADARTRHGSSRGISGKAQTGKKNLTTYRNRR
ncbi:MAG: pyridoxal phosphate-dependent aminotransferase [Acutalibacteraceae bacterium]